MSDKVAFEYEVVDDSLRTTSTSRYNNDPAVKDLLDGKTVRIANFTRTSILYKLARANHRRLRTRTEDSTHTIVWMVPDETESATEITEITPETAKETAKETANA